jgi:hypothetical protein
MEPAAGFGNGFLGADARLQDLRTGGHPVLPDGCHGLTGSSGLAQSQGGMGCFSCNAAIELAAGERVGFRDTCEACDSDLHVCLNCIHYDSNAYNQCREPNAEWVSERERANRCDYFSYGDRLRDTASAERARTSLDDLFKKP